MACERTNERMLKSLSEGTSPSGDQIPWKVSEQFQDSEFPSLSGARIVRIAVHPNLIRVCIRKKQIIYSKFCLFDSESLEESLYVF